MKLLALAAAAAAALPLAHAACDAGEFKCVDNDNSPWYVCDTMGNWHLAGECGEDFKCVIGSGAGMPSCVEQ